MKDLSERVAAKFEGRAETNVVTRALESLSNDFHRNLIDTHGGYTPEANVISDGYMSISSDLVRSIGKLQNYINKHGGR